MNAEVPSQDALPACSCGDSLMQNDTVEVHTHAVEQNASLSPWYVLWSHDPP